MPTKKDALPCLKIKRPSFQISKTWIHSKIGVRNASKYLCPNMLNTEFINQRTAFYNVSTLQRLQNSWWIACLFCLLFITGCFSCLYIAWQPIAALNWLLQAAAVNSYVLWLLRKGLKKNYHPEKEILLPNIGYANWLTTLRGVLISVLAGFLLQSTLFSTDRSNWLAWAPGAIYILASILDYFDGYIARLTKHETRLGEWLDTKIDALGLLVASVLAIGYNRLPIFYIGVGLAYYLFQLGIWHRKKKGKPVKKLRPHPAKRMIAGFQMGLVAVALLPVFSLPAMTIAAFIFMIPLLSSFLRDWFVICGYVEVNSFQHTRWDRHIAFLFIKLLPVFLRVIIVIAGIFFFYEARTALFTGKETLSSTLLDLSVPYDLPELLIMATVGLMIALGIGARIAALIICILLAGTLTTWHLPLSLFFIFSCAVALMLTGSGFLSAWHPEDPLLLERQG